MVNRCHFGRLGLTSGDTARKADGNAEGQLTEAAVFEPPFGGIVAQVRNRVRGIAHDEVGRVVVKGTLWPANLAVLICRWPHDAFIHFRPDRRRISEDLPCAATAALPASGKQQVLGTTQTAGTQSSPPASMCLANGPGIPRTSLVDAKWAAVIIFGRVTSGDTAEVVGTPRTANLCDCLGHPNWVV